MSSRIWRSLRYLFGRHVLRQPFMVAESDQEKFRIRFKTEDVVGRNIYKRGDYEPDISAYVRNNLHLAEGEVALDIGANIGWYSLLFSRLAAPGARIFSFEPDALNFRLLSENLANNGATSVTPINLAVSNVSETKRLYKYASKNLGRHSLLDINSDGHEDVQAISMDEFLPAQGIDPSRVKVMKVDIEGYEYFALQGAASVLADVRCLICEYVPRHMINGGLQPAAILELLESHGLQPYMLRAGRPQPVSRDVLLQQESVNLIWLRHAP